MNANARENLEPQPLLPPHAPHVRLSSNCDGSPICCRAATPVILVGARRDCDLSLPQPGVSKIHCAIVNTGRTILVRDLLSRSGTFLNAQPVRTAVLRPGDALQVGPALVRVKFSDGRRPPQVQQTAPLRLTTPLRLELAHGHWEMVDNASVIGRRHGSDLVIDSPDVSVAHALLFVMDGRPAVCDLGSRSGTFVNGERVDLRWLNDGDQLEIGGERLTVRYAVPAPAVAYSQLHAAAPNAEPPVAENDPLSVTRDSQPPEPAADSSTLTELNRTLAAVQAQCLAAQQRVDERELQVEQREVAAARQSADLQSRDDALAQAKADFERRAAEAQQKLAADQTRIQDARTELEQQRRALNEATQARRREEETLRQRAAELQATAAQLAQNREALEREQAEHAATLALLAERQEHVAEQEAILASRRRELDEREASLAAREARDAALREKIAQFKALLGPAGEPSGPTGSPGTGRTSGPPASSTKQSAAPTSSTQDRSAPKASEPRSARIAEDELPAPVVDRPLFTDGRVAPPPDWPPELRQRFHVLRRVSDKSDEELLTQVWADREKVLEQSASSDQRAAKRKRRSWGN